MSENELQELNVMQQAYATLFCVANKVQAYSDEKLGDISSRQLMTMVAIVHLSPEETTLKNIAAMLGTSKQNTNKLLNSFQKKGCIEILPNVKDKRSINVQLAEVGIQLMNKGAEWSLLKRISRFDGLPYLGFEADMTENKKLSSEEELIMLKFREIRGGEVMRVFVRIGKIGVGVLNAVVVLVIVVLIVQTIIAGIIKRNHKITESGDPVPAWWAGRHYDGNPPCLSIFLGKRTEARNHCPPLSSEYVFGVQYKTSVSWWEYISARYANQKKFDIKICKRRSAILRLIIMAHQIFRITL